jgi:branched-chain amino acid transport system permease protein
VPALLDFPLFRLFQTSFPAYKAFMLLVSVGIFVFLFVILTRTRAGLIIQASLTHPGMVAMLGHDVPRVFMLVFGTGSALAGLAGVIAGPVLGTFPGMAQVLGSIVFVVVVIGGLGSLTGALAASLLIAIVQTFAVALDVSLNSALAAVGLRMSAGGLLHDLWKVTVAQVAPIMPYLLLVLILIVRPTGLFGTRET